MQRLAVRPVPGHYYSLDEIKSLTASFKAKTFLRTDHGVFHLYWSQADKAYWIAGPFQGKDSNIFLFLGSAKSDTEMKKLIVELRKTEKQQNQHRERPLFSIPENFSYDPYDSWGYGGSYYGFFDFLDHLDHSYDWDFGSW